MTRGARVPGYAGFNNDVGGHAPVDALTLRRMMERSTMKRQPFVVGLIAGAAAVLGGYQLIRSRHADRLHGPPGGDHRRLARARAGAGSAVRAQGARVCLLARDEDELDRAAAQVAQSGDAGVETYACDVRSKDEVERVIAEILERHSGIDVLVNNAGAIQVGPLEHMQTEDFENAMATHFWGPLYLMQACLPAMKRRGFGRIVNISSIGGRIAVPHLAPYSASKFALVGLSDAVRAEVAQHGIRVTTVVARPDAHRLADQCRVQGAARSGVRLVRDCGLRSRDCRSAPSARRVRFSTPAGMAIPS